ncbi:3-hydroxybutyryl-CoA dehydrogenase [Chitinophaga costaii]|uniref:3-hydroxybutyryl-CoA dehydrogenase n=1 Tax=Chitinophaga costaii TaxID=1335309 RepID=A0A1C4DJ74_9BACT|nr:3-hydroxyacyl-CoA dehydrogenase [Chitinophaga costaii]PUZ24661.1 3-hydroxyacyl-CoA dehydrogenase [Chitinophaga costaii]SCC31423.1 3-hydroxybutyryl-CoA dehydrogenase [Chitinophaga costaii]
MEIKNIVVAGSGTMGYQIAFQIAYKGYKVKVYDINDAVLEKAKSKFNILSEAYKKDIGSTNEQLKTALNNLDYTSNLELAVKDADLVIEAVPENIEIKESFYTQLAKLAPEKTIFTTNSSTMLPSLLAKFTGRPEKFLTTHFGIEVWKHNLTEIMGHPATDPTYFDIVTAFIKSIGMVPIILHKEQAGYVLNTLLVPFLQAGLGLLVNGVSDYQTIDKTWMIATDAPFGPFSFMDTIGLTTVYNVFKLMYDTTKDPSLEKIVTYLKTEHIDKGKLGEATGEGFYKHPNPNYKSKEFLK